MEIKVNNFLPSRVIPASKLPQLLNIHICFEYTWPLLNYSLMALWNFWEHARAYKVANFFVFSLIRFSNSLDGYCIFSIIINPIQRALMLISTFISKYLDLPFDFHYYKPIPNHKSEILPLYAIASGCLCKMSFLNEIYSKLSCSMFNDIYELCYTT